MTWMKEAICCTLRTRKNRGCLSKSMESCGCSKKIKHGWRRLLSGNAWTYSSCKKRLGLREIFYSIGRGLEEVAVVKLSGITRSKVIFLPCDLEMRFAPQRCPIFRHLNFKGGPNLCTRRFSAPTFPPSRPTNH